MDTLNIFHSEDTSEVNNQTSSKNNISKAIQNILSDQKTINNFNNNDNNKINERTFKKNDLLNKINSKKIQTKSVEKLKESNTFHKTSPYTFKYFYKMKNGRPFHNSSSNGKLLNDKNYIKSNFINLSKEANIYTSNADYIKNKKIILFDEDKSLNDNNNINKEEVSSPRQILNKKFTLYKTTMFRGGKLLGDNKKEEKESMNKKNENKSKRYYKINKKMKFHNKFKDMPIDNMIDFIEQNKENLFPKKNKKVIIDYDSLKKEKFIPHYSLYEQVMFKKDKIFDDIKKNINNENSNYSKKISHNSSYLNYNFNNSAINNSMDINCSLNNSDINKFNNSSKNINNLSGYSNLLSKKGKDGIPIIFPIIYSSFGNFNSNSQSSRYETIMDNFMKLKTLIDNEKSLGNNNELDYIKEFLINKNIDKQYINSKNITNFSNFLKCEKLPIDLDKSLKENILLALNFNKEKKRPIKDKRLLSPTFNKNKFCRNRSSFFNNSKNNLNENSSLILDLSKQKKLFKKDEEKNDNILKKELKEEINLIEDEIKNKQEKINDVEKNLNLIPFFNNYYKKNKRNSNINKKNESIGLRLASMKEINKSKLMKNYDEKEKKKNSTSNLFDANERLYYTWYRELKRGDIKNFMRKTKLTEFIMFNKTREKLFYDKIDDIISNI